jgi:Flp pilus assembly protein TadD
MPVRLLGLGAVTMVLALTAVSAQQDQRSHAAQTHPGQHRMSLEQVCAPHMSADGAQTSAQHTAHLASVLGLTADQSVAVERATNEFCAAMKKFHEQVHEILTPEQRAKLRALHGDGH